MDERRGVRDRFHRPARPLKPRHAGEIPNRYSVKEDEEGPYLTCVEAPELKVRIAKGLSVSASAARKAPEGTIFLDGAAQSEPFLDLERRVYNLDHHEGIVRPFTLATCEQALVLVARHLDLREKPWEVLANAPDLDVLLAIWVLLNSMHLQEKGSAIMEIVTPLVRLEGVIDSHGFELAGLTGFPPDLLDETRRRLDRLREVELEYQEDKTAEAGAVYYVAAQLQALDRMVYPADFFQAFRGIEELAKVELLDNRVAVVVRCDCGIYEVETELKRLYGKRLGVIVLEKEPGAYTLRQVDAFLAVNLRAAYQKLNVLDPAVKSSDSADRWGGSGEIGGSPRTSGTALSPVDIAEALRLAYGKPSVADRLRAVALATFVSALPMVAGWLATRLVAPLGEADGASFLDSQSTFLGAGLSTALLLSLIFGWGGRHRVLGFQWPEGHRWVWMTFGVVAGAIMGGVWLVWPATGPPYPPRPPSPAMWLALFGFPLLAEFTFRGLAHSIMMHRFRVQHSQGKWFISWPNVVSAALYAAWTIPLWSLTLAATLWPGAAMMIVPVGAVVTGLSLGAVRERSGSQVACLFLHYLAVFVLLLAGSVLR